jgi:hypothetical protein
LKLEKIKKLGENIWLYPYKKHPKVVEKQNPKIIFFITICRSIGVRTVVRMIDVILFVGRLVD